MALWRDPLDELIDELERAVPAGSVASHDLFDLALMQRWTTVVLYGTDDDRARMQTEPWYQEWTAQLDRFAQAARR